MVETDYGKYAVLNVSGDTAPGDVRNFAYNHQYVKLVLVADWNILEEEFYIWGISGEFCGLIIDLNGHTMSMDRMNVGAKYIEFLDSSIDGSGVLNGGYIYSSTVIACVVRGGTYNLDTHAFALTVSTETTFSMYGGVINGGMNAVRFKVRSTDVTANFIMYGGSLNGGVVVESYPLPGHDSFDVSNYKINTAIAPYMKVVTYGENGYPSTVEAYDAYAVSTTPYASSAYNYAYGYQWELSAAELANLEIPTDKTYYLWGRGKDGWYEYLDLRCTDGQTWQAA